MLEEALAQSVKAGRLLRPRVRIVDDSAEAEHERGEVVDDWEAPREDDELPVDSELLPRCRRDGADGLLEALPDRVQNVAGARRRSSIERALSENRPSRLAASLAARLTSRGTGP